MVIVVVVIVVILLIMGSPPSSEHATVASTLISGLVLFNPRYAKLHLWNITDYQKIIYVDSDMMALKNLDSLFHEYPEFSAAPDLHPGKFNSGIFVLEPNRTTYERMLNTYR